MKLDELIQRVGVDNVGVQVLSDSVTGAKQRRGYVDVSFGTDCVSMRDIATGEWENVVFVVSVKRGAFEAARDAALSQKPVSGE
ncbi:hypothetical protein [Paraburkholderia sp. BL9I2N2]|uniref:hypothetical protein n=1 Tax=Paraburkholderia sp. BL9I2N2 TaxID=1938809 RepID=UPI001045B6C9|nr:hypothetical protein [Paraburkholderia sp. BL9I2N2]TCK87314.1 hypothetical protein B0G74_7853 [Paraburkholderia sp. BL9I2N2]